MYECWIYDGEWTLVASYNDQYNAERWFHWQHGKQRKVIKDGQTLFGCFS